MKGKVQSSVQSRPSGSLFSPGLDHDDHVIVRGHIQKHNPDLGQITLSRLIDLKMSRHEKHLIRIKSGPVILEGSVLVDHYHFLQDEKWNDIPPIHVGRIGMIDELQGRPSTWDAKYLLSMIHDEAEKLGADFVYDINWEWTKKNKVAFRDSGFQPINRLDDNGDEVVSHYMLPIKLRT